MGRERLVRGLFSGPVVAVSGGKKISRLVFVETSWQEGAQVPSPTLGLMASGQVESFPGAQPAGSGDPFIAQIRAGQGLQFTPRPQPWLRTPSELLR